MVEECPVCIERTAQPQFPFSCGHPVCRNCSRRMSLSELHRCPTCRAPREGMTAAQAAPQEEPLGEIRPYASLFRAVSRHSMRPIPQVEAAPLSTDFAAALLMVQQERQTHVPFDLSQLDDETRQDIQSLSELPISIAAWQQRRREQEEQRRLAHQLARQTLEQD